MEEAQTASVKYIYLDIVSFSTGRSVEAQASIVVALNDCVRLALQTVAVAQDSLVLIPTGDGICIALLNVEQPYDVHLRIAFAIIEQIDTYNEHEPSGTRRFQVRVGVNANTDNVIVDINDRRNVAGAGVNTAARIMSLAGPSQILVGTTVFDLLNEREKYIGHFRTYEGTVKHGRSLKVHQVVGEYQGLDISVPPAFAPKPQRKPKLDRTTAYYLMLALNFRRLSLAANEWAPVVWLWYRASDAVEAEQKKEHQEAFFKTHGFGIASSEEQLAHYTNLEFRIICDLSDLIGDVHLEKYSDCFEDGDFDLPDWRIVSEHGKSRLAKEWPDLFDQLVDGAT